MTLMITQRGTIKVSSNKFSGLGAEVGDLVHDKQYDDLLTIARILDKLFRLANDPTAFDENPYKDIVGYAILGMDRHDR